MTTASEFVAAVRADVGTITETTVRSWYNANVANLGGGDWDWCAAYATWRVAHSGVLGVRTSYVPSLKSWAQSQGIWHSGSAGLQPGDVITFDWNANGTPDHTGFVVAINGATLTTVEGNTSTSDPYVRSKTRYASQIHGYIHPSYTSAPAPVPTAQTTTQPTPTIEGETEMRIIRNTENGSVSLVYPDGCIRPISSLPAYSGLQKMSIPIAQLSAQEYAEVINWVKR